MTPDERDQIRFRLRNTRSLRRKLPDLVRLSNAILANSDQSTEKRWVVVRAFTRADMVPIVWTS